MIHESVLTFRVHTVYLRSLKEILRSLGVHIYRPEIFWDSGHIHGPYKVLELKIYPEIITVIALGRTSRRVTRKAIGSAQVLTSLEGDHPLLVPSKRVLSEIIDFERMILELQNA